MQNRNQDNERKVSEIQQRVLDIINGVNSSESTLDSGLSDLGINSIDFIKIIVTLEEEYDLEFENEMLLFDSFTDINSIVDYIMLKLSI